MAALTSTRAYHLQIGRSLLRLKGLGAYWKDRLYATPAYSILGFKLGIVQLEMFNILLALRCWAKFWAHKAILVHCDNMAVVR